MGNRLVVFYYFFLFSNIMGNRLFAFYFYFFSNFNGKPRSFQLQTPEQRGQVTKEELASSLRRMEEDLVLRVVPRSAATAPMSAATAVAASPSGPHSTSR